MSIAQRAPSSLDQQFIGFQIIRSFRQGRAGKCAIELFMKTFSHLVDLLPSHFTLSNCEQLIAMLSHIDRDSLISQDVDPGNQ